MTIAGVFDLRSGCKVNEWTTIQILCSTNVGELELERVSATGRCKYRNDRKFELKVQNISQDKRDNQTNVKSYRSWEVSILDSNDKQVKHRNKH